MLYSERNLYVSTALELSRRLRDAGFSVFFWDSQVEEPHTSDLPEAIETITLLKRFPDDPTRIVGLNSGRSNRDEVVIPALAIAVLDAPRTVRAAGIGERVCEREREILIQGLATSDTHMLITEVLSDWLDQVDSKIPVNDYSDPGDPRALPPVEVHRVVIISPEDSSEVGVYRYQIQADLHVRYFE